MRAIFLTFWNWKSSFWILSLSAVGWLALPQMSLSILLPPLLTAPCAECIMLVAADMATTTRTTPVLLLGLSAHCTALLAHALWALARHEPIQEVLDEREGPSVCLFSCAVVDH